MEATNTVITADPQEMKLSWDFVQAAKDLADYLREEEYRNWKEAGSPKEGHILHSVVAVHQWLAMHPELLK